MTQLTMPVIFVSHNSPMLAVDEELGGDLAQWSAQLPMPKAVLVISAHWETEGLCLGETAAHQELIYDFYNFPDALYDLQYPAPGAPWLVEGIRKLLPDTPINLEEGRGLDHGVWVPLLRLWPQADVPVLQLSLPSRYPAQQLWELGTKLAPLRQQGVLIMGSGAITHNLSALRQRHQETPHWVSEFDTWVATTLENNPQDLLEWENLAPHARDNHPTLEHFLPLLICAGAARADDPVRFPITGYEMHLFTRRCVQFG